MHDIELKQKIQEEIQSFATKEFDSAALGLLNAMEYDSQRRLSLETKKSEEFIEIYDQRELLSREKACIGDWKGINLLFQLTDDDLKLNRQQVLPIAENTIINQFMKSYLFFALELKNENYTRTQLAQITREINKLFLIPVMIVFKHGQKISISIINRRPHKREPEKDVLEKVTLIKDIHIKKPHRAHIEILYDLSLAKIHEGKRIDVMDDLHEAWQIVLDIKELNKNFYKELSNWYFWAVQECVFPIEAGDDETRNPTSVIRLITRLIFIWFIKEKGLIPDELFNKDFISTLLNSLDNNETTYYKAILQNLFFGTLNQEDFEKRKFIEENDFQGKHKQYGITNIYRYKRLLDNPDNLLRLLKDISFLNGGLFECLDREREENEPVPDGCELKMRRIDGFSENPKNLLSVPNELFFNEEKQIDLNAIYGTKNKRYKVRGLLNILHSYKFTIEENTPLEEEVALDPELLGRVFENLLASYNPETRTTARKSTGSFYTPREIVNYMVDESLMAYFDQKLMEYEPNPTYEALTPSQPKLSGENQPGLPSEIKIDEETSPYKNRLDHLFSLQESLNPFNKKETSILIKSIDEIKVLDPACGSGAFPMGILHKLVFLLEKLDPHNEQWKQCQIEKIYAIEDLQVRESTLNSIEEIFEKSNEFNFGRKLYLIQNCIFGVDIQPIAVQIAKLRFFISLVVEQRIDDSKVNRGILSLPNLESKFVAANTLLSLEKPSPNQSIQMALGDDVIEGLKERLLKTRRAYFSANTREKKLNFQKQDRDLRKRLDIELQKHGWSTISAKQIAIWDPYNQNLSAEFFDPEWMFGIDEGFDVVIGNPPYTESRHPSFKIELKDLYQIAIKNRWLDDSVYISRGSDLLIYFFETSIFYIKQSGCVALITQNSWLDTEYGKLFQNFLLKNTQVRKIIDSDFRYFSSGECSNINTVITIFKGKKPDSNSYVEFVRQHKSFKQIPSPKTEMPNNKFADIQRYISTNVILHNLKWGILLASSPMIIHLLEILSKKALRLENVNGYNLSFGQGLNLDNNQLIDKNVLLQFDFTQKAAIPFFTTEDGASFVVVETEKYILDKTKLSSNEIKSLNYNHIHVFDPNTTTKIPPKLMMPRGVSRHFCALNSIGCFSSSFVDLYDFSKNIDQTPILNLWLFFNSSIGWLLREICGRKNLGGGLLKSEAVDLKSLPIYMNFNRQSEIKEIINNLKDRKALVTIDEIETSDHKIIDQIVFDHLCLPNNLRTIILDTLKTKIILRNKKAKT